MLDKAILALKLVEAGYLSQLGLVKFVESNEKSIILTVEMPQSNEEHRKRIHDILLDMKETETPVLVVITNKEDALTSE
mgnify:CR=1 FL=1